MTVGFNASLHTHNRSPRAFVIDQEVKKRRCISVRLLFNLSTLVVRHTFLQ